MQSHSVDLILIDNFMDIASRLVRDKATGKCFFVHSTSYSQELFSKRFDYTEFISSKDSISNYLTIINWLRLFQPNAVVYFVPLPSAVHGHDDRESVKRAAEFRRDLAIGSLSVPVLNMPNVQREHMLAADDWCHYAPAYYQDVACQISI